MQRPEDELLWQEGANQKIRKSVTEWLANGSGSKIEMSVTPDAFEVIAGRSPTDSDFPHRPGFCVLEFEANEDRTTAYSDQIGRFISRD